MTNETYQNDVQVPAALNLPFGKLFFGFKVKPYKPSAPKSPPGPPAAPGQQPSFSGAGATLSGRTLSAPPTSKGKGKEKETDEERDWGSGHALGSRSTIAPTAFGAGGSVGAGGALVPQLRIRNGVQPKEVVMIDDDDDSDGPDWGVDDDDIIDIDSD